MNFFCFLGMLLLFFPIFGQDNPISWSSRLANEEESLFLRRIADFWQEGEYGIAKKQIEEFLAAFPESAFADPLHAALGDLLMGEKEYSAALNAYSSISLGFSSKTLLNRMQCLYFLEKYSTLTDECEAYLRNPSDSDVELEATYFLAIALYRQCLNASKDPDMLLTLAQRAMPCFERLIESKLSTEVSHAFAHLCCILKDYPKAAGIYLDLAEQRVEDKEEMLFQAALIQAEYDKELALHSFQSIIELGGARSQEASYNQLVLSFEIGLHEQILANKESVLAAVPEDRKAEACLFLGKSFFALKKYEDAIGSLKEHLVKIPSSEPALTCLLEAAYRIDDLKTLDEAIAGLLAIAPESHQLAKGHLARSLLLKKRRDLVHARKELTGLLTRFPDFPDRDQALFEWTDLEYRDGSWPSCRRCAYAFLEQYPNSPLRMDVWRYLAAASNQLAVEDPSLMDQFANDLEALLEQDGWSVSEKGDWQFFLAKAYYDLGRVDSVVDLIRSLLEQNISFSQEANARLLFAICHRDFFEDSVAFCLHAEEAIAKKATLIEMGTLHVSLFNAYLELSQTTPELIDQAADHLHKAFLFNAELLTKENILWLGDWCSLRFEQEKNPVWLERAAVLFSFLVDSQEPSRKMDETAMYKLGKVYSLTGQTEKQIVLMEQLVHMYTASSSDEWIWEKEAKLLLARGYAGLYQEEKAMSLFDEIIGKNALISSEIVATAALEKARLGLKRFQKERGDSSRVAAQLKDLILQKKLSNEPVHLEAAIEYVDLLGVDPEKRLRLLEKIKSDFEYAGDVLSQDYQCARLKLDEKNRIYEGYMRFIEGEMYLAQAALAKDEQVQKELQAKTMDLLLQITHENAHPMLVNRASLCLQNAKWIHVPAAE